MLLFSSLPRETMQGFASQHTASFASFLRQAGVSIAVTTYQAGQLVLVHAQEDHAHTHFVAMKKPMGLAVEGSQRLAVGDADRIDFYRNLPAVGQHIDRGQYDAAYLFRATHVTGDIDIHEMGFDLDSQLWLINSRMSCLCTLSADASILPRWKPPFISQYDLLDRCHLNGLGFRDGRPRYVSMLGASDEPGGWRRNKTGGGQIMDIVNDRVMAGDLCMPHSPRWHRDYLWFLSSGEGALKRVERGGSVTTVVELPGFTRGLEFFGQYALIGLSQVRETAVFAGLPLTRRVEQRQCGVYLVDLDQGRVIGFLHFVGDVQEIFDIKLLPHRRPSLVEAHSALLSTSYELPPAALALLAPSDPMQDALASANRAHASGDFSQAILLYQQIVCDLPHHAQAKQKLGLVLTDAERWQEGRDVLSLVVAEQPHSAEAWNGLGLCAARLQDFAYALNCFQRAIDIDQQFALARFNRGLILLKLERYAEGWPDYEWRWQLPSFAPFRCPQPQWQGEDIGDKRLLVHSEQGHGDHIQFWRYLRLARERCRELIYVGPESLAELAANIEGVDESRLPGALPSDRFDCFVPLLNLPLCLGLNEPLVEAKQYVQAPAHVQVRRLDGKHRVGLVWQGSPTHRDDRRRSLPAQSLLAALETVPASFFSLQFPIDGATIELLRRYGVHNLEPEIHGYSRTAAFVDQLDVVVTVDTALAHLAGAMGKPVYLLLAKDADWRWGIRGETTCWYPQMRLLRQSTAGDWEPVLHDLASLLRQQLV